MVKSELEFTWSKDLHFVDAEGIPPFIMAPPSYIDVFTDNPPTSCSVEEIRDCAGDFCIRKSASDFEVMETEERATVAAIANYTTRVVDPTLDAEQIQEALKFIGASIFSCVVD